MTPEGPFLNAGQVDPQFEMYFIISKLFHIVNIVDFYTAINVIN